MKTIRNRIEYINIGGGEPIVVILEYVKRNHINKSLSRGIFSCLKHTDFVPADLILSLNPTMITGKLLPLHWHLVSSSVNLDIITSRNHFITLEKHLAQWLTTSEDSKHWVIHATENTDFSARERLQIETQRRLTCLSQEGNVTKRPQFLGHAKIQQLGIDREKSARLVSL